MINDQNTNNYEGSELYILMFTASKFLGTFHTF